MSRVHCKHSLLIELPSDSPLCNLLLIANVKRLNIHDRSRHFSAVFLYLFSTICTAWRDAHFQDAAHIYHSWLKWPISEAWYFPCFKIQFGSVIAVSQVWCCCCCCFSLFFFPGNCSEENVKWILCSWQMKPQYWKQHMESEVRKRLLSEH